ncbi:MAG: DUF4333 domain-containing protein [Acidobacteriota bacterium]
MKSGILSVIALVVVGGGAATYFLNRNKIDTSDANDKLKKIVEKVVAPVASVDCPKAERKKGSTFTCKVVFVGGHTGSLKVTITNDDGNFDLDWEKPIASAERTAESITNGIKTQSGKDAKVDCGKGIVDLPPDGIQCTVTVEGQTGHATVKWDPKNKQPVWSVGS